MRLTDQNVRSLLAAEYALGTLSGAARLRFTVLAAQDSNLAAEVVRWQIRLGTLSHHIEPLAPGPWVWQSLERRLGLGRNAPRGPVSPQRPRTRTIGLWRGAAALAGACAIVLAILLVQEQPAPPAIIEVVEVPTEPAPAVSVSQAMAVVLSNPADQTGWLIVQQHAGAPLVARAVSPAPLAADRSYELWLLPTGRPPISVGLAPVEGEITVTPPPELAELIEPGLALAISLEPKGGSPTGLPTGPVMYQGEVVVM